MEPVGCGSVSCISLRPPAAIDLRRARLPGSKCVVRFTAEHGFTLLEILIAVLVLSIGVLGVAGMQVAGLRGNQESLQRSQAAVLASEIADRMRANPKAARNGSYRLAIGTPGAAPSSISSVIADCDGETACSPEQLAMSDLHEWQQHVHDNLPGSTGQIDCAGSCTEDSLQTITLYWDQYREGVTGTGCTDHRAADDRTRDSDLSCIRISVQP